MLVEETIPSAGRRSDLAIGIYGELGGEVDVRAAAWGISLASIPIKINILEGWAHLDELRSRSGSGTTLSSRDGGVLPGSVQQEVHVIWCTAYCDDLNKAKKITFVHILVFVNKLLKREEILKSTTNNNFKINSNLFCGK